MKKITFNTLPEAISELIDRVEKIEKLLNKRGTQLKTKSAPAPKGRGKGKTRRQETPAGLLSVKEAGKLLKMSLVNLYSYVKNKKIPFEKRGRRLYFSRTALESWNKSRNEQVSGDNITIKDAVKLLKVPASTIYYKIKSQKLKPTVKRGNKLLFSKRELINSFSKPLKRGRKAANAKPAVKPASTKTTAVKAKKGKSAPAAKARVAKTTKVSKRGRPAKAKQAQASKPAVEKPVAEKQGTEKPVEKQAKKSKQAKVKKAPVKKVPVKKAKPSKPAKEPKPEIPPSAETPAQPETPAPGNGNSQPETGKTE